MEHGSEQGKGLLEGSAGRLLHDYAALLRYHSARLDLVSPRDLVRLEMRHLADSLTPLPLIASVPAGFIIDVGSGAGLPGVPLAIADRSHFYRLLEPRQKRAAFLEEVLRVLGLDGEVLTMTAQEAARDPALRAGHVAATARALAPPQRAAAMMLPLLEPRGSGIIWLGRSALVPPRARLWRPGLAIITPDRHAQRGGVEDQNAGE